MLVKISLLLIEIIVKSVKNVFGNISKCLEKLFNASEKYFYCFARFEIAPELFC